MADEILHEFLPLIRVYKDNRVERLWPFNLVPPSTDSTTGVQSKDIKISPETNLSARLYLPKNADPSHKLPLLVHFHGGAWVFESAFSQTYLRHLNLLASQANIIIVSVDYRLAPENPLPIAYEDCWESLKWVAQTTDDWIKHYADLNNVYLAGDSPGGNMAHQMAIRIGTETVKGLNLNGIILNSPFFAGKEAIGDEETDEVFPKIWIEKFWEFVCPGTSGLDDPLINPAMDSRLSKLGCKKVLVYEGEKDVLCVRGWFYKEALVKSGWGGDVEVVEVEGEGHVFSVQAPDTDNAKAYLKKVADFINGKTVTGS